MAKYSVQSPSSISSKATSSPAKALRRNSGAVAPRDAAVAVDATDFQMARILEGRQPRGNGRGEGCVHHRRRAGLRQRFMRPLVVVLAHKSGRSAAVGARAGGRRAAASSRLSAPSEIAHATRSARDAPARSVRAQSRGGSTRPLRRDNRAEARARKGAPVVTANPLRASRRRQTRAQTGGASRRRWGRATRRSAARSG